MKSVKNCPDNIIYTNVDIIRDEKDKCHNYKEELTYLDVLDEATKLGAGIENHKLFYHSKNEYKHYDLKLVGVMSKNKIEWYFFLILLFLSKIIYCIFIIIFKSVLNEKG